MNQNNSENIINSIKKLLKSKYPSFKGLYFFGSRNKDKYDEYSDYDIALVFNEEITWKFKDEVRGLIYDIMLQADIVIDTHIYSIKEMAEPITPFRNAIKSEGTYYGI